MYKYGVQMSTFMITPTKYPNLLAYGSALRNFNVVYAFYVHIKFHLTRSSQYHCNCICLMKYTACDHEFGGHFRGVVERPQHMIVGFRR